MGAWDPWPGLRNHNLQLNIPRKKKKPSQVTQWPALSTHQAQCPHIGKLPEKKGQMCVLQRQKLPLSIVVETIVGQEQL